jgi:hypothetical protein
MSVALLELNEAKSAIKSGTVIEVSKKAFEGAMERGLENAGLMEALEIDVREGCDGCDGAGDGGGKFKVVVFFDSRHGGARGEIESKMKESKMKESDESEGPTDTKVPEESKMKDSKALKARVVEEALRGVKGPRLVRFHLAVAGARKAVWVPIDSKLENALRWMVVEEMKDTEVPKESETDGPMAPMAPNEPEVPKETGGAMEPKTEEKKALKAEETKVPMETEPMAPMAPMETKVPMETKKKKAEKAALLRAKAAEAAEVAREAAEAAREAEREAEEEAAAERESERKETKEALERAKQTLDRAREEVEGLERQLAQQNDVERRKRKRREQGESPSRRVWARKEEKEEMEMEEMEIVMVPDREFREAVGEYGGAVHHAWVWRFESQGPGGIGPVRGGEMVLESVYGGEAGEGGGAPGELLARFAKRTGTDAVVVREFTAVRQYDAWMEENEFVKRTIDVEMRCMNPGSPAEPEWGEDTERVWMKRGSAELAALDKLIAKARSRKLQWKWQCPESPRSPAYSPSEARKGSPVYGSRGPFDDDDDDDETSCVD